MLNWVRIKKTFNSIILSDYLFVNERQCLIIISFLHKSKSLIKIHLIWFNLIWIHTLLWHRFKFDSWEKLCYVYQMNKTLWERKLLIDYMMTSRHRNNKINTMLSVMIYSFYSTCDAQANFWWKCLYCLIMMHHLCSALHWWYFIQRCFDLWSSIAKSISLHSWCSWL